MTTTVRVKMNKASGMVDDRTGASGRCSTFRTTSYPRNPQPAPERAEVGTSTGVAFETRASKSARGRQVSGWNASCDADPSPRLPHPSAAMPTKARYPGRCIEPTFLLRPGLIRAEMQTDPVGLSRMQKQRCRCRR